MMWIGRILCVLAPLTVAVFVVMEAALMPPADPKPLVAVPAFRLFPPNAAISLTEDNSTFFPARPAAFGPELPDNGLSAILWIGAGFGEDGIEPQGELGCSDVSGWDGRRAVDGAPILPTEMDLDDGTDNYLEDLAGLYLRQLRKSSRGQEARPVVAAALAAAAAAAAAAAETAPAAAATGSTLAAPVIKASSLQAVAAAGGRANGQDGSRHGNIQSLQEGAEIAGKIVLLRRGGCGFLAKVMWAQRRGAVAVIVGDDRKGGPLIQMYASGDTSGVLIPSVFTAHTTAHLLTALAVSAVQEDRAALRRRSSSTTTTETTDETDEAAAEATGSGEKRPWFWRHRAQREWVLDEYVPTDAESEGGGQTQQTQWPRAAPAGGVGNGAADADSTAPAAGEMLARPLSVTIAPARGGLPLMDTLLVLVASPLLAIVTITCVLLFLRAHCRQRAWRAPKALVDQLPVHIYRPPGAAPPSPVLVPAGSEVASPNPSRPSSPALAAMHPTLTTPLLQQRPRSRTTTGVPGDERRARRVVEPPPPPPSRYVQNECVVCLEDFAAGDRVMSLPCGHEFHAACIIPWLTTRRRTCPICKGDIVRGAATSDAA